MHVGPLFVGLPLPKAKRTPQWSECKLCNMVYIGNTQNKNKKRQNQHFGEVKRLVEKGQKSDSFAEHFANHFKEKSISKVNSSMVRARTMVRMKILWKAGNIISCMKSFNKRTCKLFVKERVRGNIESYGGKSYY